MNLEIKKSQELISTHSHSNVSFLYFKITERSKIMRRLQRKLLPNAAETKRSTILRMVYKINWRYCSLHQSIRTNNLLEPFEDYIVLCLNILELPFIIYCNELPSKLLFFSAVIIPNSRPDETSSTALSTEFLNLVFPPIKKLISPSNELYSTKKTFSRIKKINENKKTTESIEADENKKTFSRCFLQDINVQLALHPRTTPHTTFPCSPSYFRYTKPFFLSIRKHNPVLHTINISLIEIHAVSSRIIFNIVSTQSLDSFETFDVSKTQTPYSSPRCFKFRWNCSLRTMKRPTPETKTPAKPTNKFQTLRNQSIIDLLCIISSELSLIFLDNELLNGLSPTFSIELMNCFPPYLFIESNFPSDETSSIALGIKFLNFIFFFISKLIFFSNEFYSMKKTFSQIKVTRENEKTKETIELDKNKTTFLHFLLQDLKCIFHPCTNVFTTSKYMHRLATKSPLLPPTMFNIASIKLHISSLGIILQKICIQVFNISKTSDASHKQTSHTSVRWDKLRCNCSLKKEKRYSSKTKKPLITINKCKFLRNFSYMLYTKILLNKKTLSIFESKSLMQKCFRISSYIISATKYTMSFSND